MAKPLKIVGAGKNGINSALAFSPDYYAKHCGPVTYDRSEAIWGVFFGNIADQLIRAFAPHRVYDAGCAHGFLVEAFWDRGVEARGRDISTFAVSQARPDIRSFCEVGSIADPISGEFDLVTCIEVLEHMPEEDARRAIANLSAITSTIVFSSSPADLDEPTHINVRPTMYWLREYAKHGFTPLMNFDASFIAPHSLVLRRLDARPSEEELLAFADRISLRVRCSDLSRTVERLRGDASKERDKLVVRGYAEVEIARTEAEKARAAAEAARAEMNALLSSTTWRATKPIRALLSRVPAPARRQFKSLAKATLGAARRTGRTAAGNGATARVETPYERWVREHDTLDDADRSAIRAHVADLLLRPLISVAIPVYNTPERYLVQAIESVLAQLYPHWELCIADDASSEQHVRSVLEHYRKRDHRIKIVYRQQNGHISAATNSALDVASGEFVALLDHDDVLSERALYEIALEINACPEADVIYSDSDNVDDLGRRWGPYFKTDWDPDLMFGHNMVSHLGVYRHSVLTAIGGLRVGFEGSQDYDLLLRATELSKDERIRHVPSILYHWRRNASSPSFSEQDLPACVTAARRAIKEHLDRKGIAARVEAAPRAPNFNRVVYTLPKEPPLVSIIVPTRDRADLLRRCVESVFINTNYSPLEVIIVDNDSSELETQNLFDKLAKRSDVRVLRHHGAFNYAAINNRAVAQARGDVIVLMNNDVEVISPGWLDEMVSHALRPEIGAVGARLLYPDGRVQHAGVVLGVGHGAGHFFHGAPQHETGPHGMLALNRRVSAVTAACLAMRRSVYLEVGGLDELNLPVAYNDVDLCLRVRERGYAIVCTPFAELLHRESASRGPDVAVESRIRLERDAMHLHKKWGPQLDRDPYYNENCSLTVPTFEPAFPPRRARPWLSYRGRDNSGRAAPVALSRSDQLLAPISRSARILEIGPSYNPIAPKSAGWDTRTIDHATRAELVAKYTGHDGVNVSRIEEVDYVWKGGAIADSVPRDLHGTFDAFITSHVIEHTTDLLDFLNSAEVLLSLRGTVILAIPDKRYCFDYFRPLATTGDVIYAHALGRSRHPRRTVFDHGAYTVKNRGSIAWGQAPVGEFEFMQTLEQAYVQFNQVSEDPSQPYVDMHGWQFTPSSFELLMLELARLEKTDWQIARATPAMGCEFHAWLKRGGKASAAISSHEELNARRMELLKKTLLELREQVDYLLAGELPP